MYAKITGIEPRNRRRNSESHLFAGLESSTSYVWPKLRSSSGFGRRDVRSFGGVEEGVEGRRNLGSQELVFFESSILVARKKSDTVLEIIYLHDTIAAGYRG